MSRILPESSRLGQSAKTDNKMLTRTFLIFGLLTLACAANAQSGNTHDELLDLFADWREFESPPLLDSAPDYTVGTFARRQGDYQRADRS